MRNQPHLGAQRPLPHIAHIQPIDQQAAAADIVKSRHQIGQRGLASASRSHQRHHRASRDAQVDIAQHRLAIAIAELHLLEVDASLDRRHLPGIGFVADSRLGMQQVDDALAAGHGCLHGGIELAQLLHGQKEAIDISQKGDDRAQGQAALHYAQPAKEQHDRCCRHAQKFDCRQENERQRHGFNVRIAVGLVDLVELLGGDVFVGKSLDDADAAEVLGQIADHVGVACASLAEGAFCPPREQGSRQHDQRNDGESDQRQLPIQRQHDQHDARQQQAIARQRDQPLRKQLIDDADIADDARYRHADDVLVVVSQWQVLDVPKERRPQIGQDALADPAEQIALRHGSRVQADEGAQHQQRHFVQRGVIAISDWTIDSELDQVGSGQRQARCQQHGNKCAEHAPGIRADENQQLPDGAQVEAAPLDLVGICVQCAAQSARADAGRANRETHSAARLILSHARRLR